VPTASDSPRVLYLGGLGRSGSTLLERLLGELPGVCPVGEVMHMWQRGVAEAENCGCGEPLPQCPFWRKVGEAAFGGWDSVDLSRVADLRHTVQRLRCVPQLAAPRLRSSLRRDVGEYTGYYLRAYAAIADVSGCPVVVDSSKHASLAYCLRWRPELDFRVVHVVRDSRAVAFSWTRQVNRPGSTADPYMLTYSPAKAARQWNLENGALQLLAWQGVPTLRVRYEDLVAEPAATLTKVADFAGIRSAEQAADFLDRDGDGRSVELRASHTASGNPMRFTTGKVVIRSDDRWKTAMPARQRRMVAGLTLPLLARYGYLRRAG
jgi:Sulfotransferase domain